MKKFKIGLIVILIVLILIFSLLLFKIKSSGIVNVSVDSSLSKEEIYDEVLTEVTQGEEKYVSHDASGNRVNSSPEMNEVEQVKGIKGLQVNGITITAKDNKTQIYGIVENTSSTDTLGDCMITISLKDDTGAEILAVGVYLDELEHGEQDVISTSVSTDLANAYSYDVSK